MGRLRSFRGAPRAAGRTTVGFRVSADAVSGPDFDVLPTLAAGNVGDSIAYTVGASADADTVVASLQRDGVDFQTGLTTNGSYTLQAADDGTVVRIRSVATNSDGARVATAARSITYAAPDITGSLTGVSLVRGDSAVTRNAGALLTGSGGSWAVTVNGQENASLASINGSGVVSLGSGTVISAGTVRATYTNTGGSDFAEFALTVADLTVAVTGTAKIGQALTATPNRAGGTYQWQRDGVDIAGATSSSYTLVAGDDDAMVRCVYTRNGVTASSGAVNVTYVAPSFSGALSSATISQDGGNVTRDAGALVTGSGLTWTVTVDGFNQPSIATVNSAGVITLYDDTLIEAATVRVTASNSGGSGFRELTLTVSDAPAEQPFVVDSKPAVAGETQVVVDPVTGGAITVSFSAAPSAAALQQTVVPTPLSVDPAVDLTSGNLFSGGTEPGDEITAYLPSFVHDGGLVAFATRWLVGGSFEGNTSRTITRSADTLPIDFEVTARDTVTDAILFTETYRAPTTVVPATPPTVTDKTITTPVDGEATIVNVLADDEPDPESPVLEIVSVTLTSGNDLLDGTTRWIADGDVFVAAAPSSIQSSTYDVVVRDTFTLGEATFVLTVSVGALHQIAGAGRSVLANWDLSGTYRVAPATTPLPAPGIDLIEIHPEFNDNGFARAQWNGPSGTFVFDLRYLKEEDGPPTFWLRKNGVQFDTFQPAVLVGTREWDNRILQLTLAPGDEFEIEGASFNGAYARLGYVDFSAPAPSYPDFGTFVSGKAGTDAGNDVTISTPAVGDYIFGFMGHRSTTDPAAWPAGFTNTQRAESTTAGFEFSLASALKRSDGTETNMAVTWDGSGRTVGYAVFSGDGAPAINVLQAIAVAGAGDDGSVTVNYDCGDTDPAHIWLAVGIYNGNGWGSVGSGGTTEVTGDRSAGNRTGIVAFELDLPNGGSGSVTITDTDGTLTRRLVACAYVVRGAAS
jgi:hypothetical protein